jgi:chromosome segregation ATPase
MKRGFMEAFGFIGFLCLVASCYLWFSREQTDFKDTKDKLKNISLENVLQKETISTLTEKVETLSKSNEALRTTYLRTKEGLDELKAVCEEGKIISSKLQLQLKDQSQEVQYLHEKCESLKQRNKEITKEQLRLDNNQNVLRRKMLPIDVNVNFVPKAEPAIKKQNQVPPKPPPQGMSGFVKETVADISEQLKAFA